MRRINDGFAENASGLFVPRRLAGNRARQQTLLMGGGDPTTDPNFASVVALLHMDGANGGTTFTDSSSYARAMTVGVGATTSTSNPKFGTAAGSLTTASTAGLKATSNNSNMTVGVQDFTVEMWLYQNPASIYLWTNNDSSHGASPAAITIFWDGGGGSSYIICYTPDGLNMVDFSYSNVSASSWNHFALVRISGVLTSYVNGVAGVKNAHLAENGNYSNTNFAIGQPYYTAYQARTTATVLDDFRYTIGVGRYAAAFTPRTTAFPNSA